MVIDYFQKCDKNSEGEIDYARYIMRKAAFHGNGSGGYAQEVTYPERESQVEVEYGDKGIATIRLKSKILSSNVVTDMSNTVANLRQDFDKAKMVFIKIDDIIGADIKEFSPGSEDPYVAINEELIRSGQAMVHEIRNFPRPIIAVIYERALGGGFELALPCDYIIAHEDATIGLPELKLGIIPGWGGTQTLTRRVGILKSLEMILGAKIVKAAEPWVDCVTSNVEESIKACISKGWIPGRVFDPITPDSFPARIDEWWLRAPVIWRMFFKKWKCHPPASFWLARDAIVQGNRKDIASGMRLEQDKIAEAFQTDDAQEGASAFLGIPKDAFDEYLRRDKPKSMKVEKRAPRFTGK
jgi:enoyl-CoA hydratase